ncbi:MAG: PQQ-like beta-propeller repeat protein [Gemmataceae bacterium]|nr:PQQ-like beta-propeller repeat protein [Gemmataceae bacterium]
MTLTGLFSAAEAADDWPTFRGPNRDDRSTDKGLLKEWGNDGPPLFWKEPASGLGTGYSGVAVAGDKVFTMGDKDGSCFVFALNRDTGKQVWESKIGKSGAYGGYAGPRGTPTVDGQMVYALGQNGDLACLEVATGKERWKKDFAKDYKGQKGGWSYSESPLVDGDKLIVTPGGKESTVIALNKSTGATIWKGVVPPNGDSAAYSSVVITEAGGVKQYVTLLGNGVAGFAAKDGKFLWRYGEAGNRFGGNTANIPTCIVADKDHIFACAGYGRGGALIKLSATPGGGVKAEEVYFNKDLNNKHGGLVQVGDYVYGGRDDQPKPYCAEIKTGKIVPGWDAKNIKTKGGNSVSVTFADGHLYFRYQNGIVALVPATPDGYKEVSSFKIPKGNGPSWPHPVVVGGKLYLRDQDLLWVYDVKQK